VAKVKLAMLLSMPAYIMNRADLPLKQRHYDTIILGAGLLGLAAAFYIKRFQPDKTVLIIEQEGVPSEAGASHVSPGIIPSSHTDKEIQSKLVWTLQTFKTIAQETAVKRPNSNVIKQLGILELFKESSETNKCLTKLKLSKTLQALLAEMINADSFSYASQQTNAAYANAEAIASYYAYGAVKLGADLMLNTRVATLTGQGLILERLEFDRFMQRVVVREDKVSAARVVFALGAQTASFAEDALGELLPYKHFYKQYPRIEADARLPLVKGVVSMPIVKASGFHFRPQGEGLLVVPPSLAADPKGYVAVEGKMMGVQVGLRRELLEQLIEYADDLPVLTWESLNLGKTLAKVRGTWEVITPSGLPEWRKLSVEHYSLVGGDLGVALGVAEAYDLAASLAAVKERPW